MKVDARLNLFDMQGPDPWDDSWRIQLPLDHIICRDVDGSPHTIGEFIWPWTAYTKDQSKVALHFYYWNQIPGPVRMNRLEVSPEREARIRELQFLMTRQIFYGNENSPKTLEIKLSVLHSLARFAEGRSCTIHDVLTDTSLLDACGASLHKSRVRFWMTWLIFLRQLDPATQLGFTPATPGQWKELERRRSDQRNNSRQYAPLPTRIYGGLINNLTAELDDIEAN